MMAKTLYRKSSNIQAKSTSKDTPRSQNHRRADEPTVKPQISIPETITSLHNYAPLLRLPSEIRREILKYLIPSSTKKFRLYADCDSSVVSTKWNRQPPKNLRRVPNGNPLNQPSPPEEEKLDLSILRTNRLIYHEALSILYSENLFHFIGFNYLPVLDFIRRLSPDAKTLVRKVRLTLLTDSQREQFQPPPNHDAFCTVIHDFLPGLTTLQADPWIFF